MTPTQRIEKIAMALRFYPTASINEARIVETHRALTPTSRAVGICATLRYSASSARVICVVTEELITTWSDYKPRSRAAREMAQYVTKFVERVQAAHALVCAV